MPGLPGGLIPRPSEPGASHGAHGHRPQAVLQDWTIPHRPSPHRLLHLEHVRWKMPPGARGFPPRAGGHLRKGAVPCHQIRRNTLPFGARPSQPKCDLRLPARDGPPAQQQPRPREKNTPEGAVHGAEPSPLAAATPMRSPVYEPGPIDTAIAWRSATLSAASASAFSIYTCNFSACWYP